MSAQTEIADEHLSSYLSMRKEQKTQENDSFSKRYRSRDDEEEEFDSGYGDDIFSSVQTISKFGFMDPMTGSATQIVYNMLNLPNANDAILECGCGTEYILPYLIQMKKNTCKLFLTDISRVKLRVVAKKCETIENTPLSRHIYDYNYIPTNEEVKEAKEPYFNKFLNVFVERADACNLPYESSIFDIYFGGMLLQEVNNPFSAIKEAFRVLKKGGRAGFTIPDSMGADNEFDLILAQAVQNITKTPTAFSYPTKLDLLSSERIADLLKRVGFTNILIWSQFVPYSFFTKADYEKHLDIDSTNQCDQEIKQEALRLFEEKLKQTNIPFGLSILCVVAQKL